MQGHSRPILEPSCIYESHKHPGKAVRTFSRPFGKRNDTAASPDGPINKAPEERLLNKPNSCQYSILELRRNTTSYGPISNPQLSTSGTDGATCLYDPKNILWQHIFSQPYAVLWAIEKISILGHPLGIDL